MLKETHFIGVLANVDESILEIHLNHDFKIKAMRHNDILDLISHLESISPNGIFEKLWRMNCINNSNIYYIDYSFEGDIETDEKGQIINSSDAVNKTESTNGIVHTYLIPTIRIMKLFKEGNISMPFRYLYFIDNRLPKPIETTMNTLYTRPELYSIESSKIADLHKFIHDVRIPFKENYIQLAFENFELSYQNINIDLSFITLMICMEILFNPQDNEISHRISRNAAVLLGKDFDDSKKIFDHIKNLYTKRSLIIHGNITHKTSKKINNKDVMELRNYVRDSIKEINKIGKSKDKLLEFLDSQGYGIDSDRKMQ